MAYKIRGLKARTGKPNFKRVYVGELGEATITDKGTKNAIRVHYIEDFDGIKSWQLRPDESRGDKIIKSAWVIPDILPKNQ